MEFTSYGVGFFFYLFVAVVASAIVSTIVELIARGDGGRITYAFSFLVTFGFVFLAFHWDVIGVWAPDEWIRKTAIASIIVTALLISAIGSAIGKAVGTALTTPAWLKDDEQAAIKAITKEKNQGKLHLATMSAKSYRVRSIACKKLGRHQAAAAEIALFDPDESVCLAALDEVNWDGWDQLLADVAVRSNKESVALKALGKISDDGSLADVAARAKSETVASEALGRIRDEELLVDIVAKMGDAQAAMETVGRITSGDALRRLSNARVVTQSTSYDTAALIRFEAGRRLGDSEACSKALDSLLDAGAEDVKAALDSIEDSSFKKEVIKQWLDSAKDASLIAERLGGAVVLEPPVDDDLEGYLCPTGSVHNYSSTSMHYDADSDDYYGIVWCESCGYRYNVDKSVYISKKHLFGCKEKTIVCRAGGYVCPSCRTAVQPNEDGLAPCICPSCGTENHVWEHYDGEIVHRDYSSGTSYDFCKRCGKKKNIVSHDTW